MFEVDFFTKLSQLRDRIDANLMHHKDTHLVLREKVVIGNIDSLIKVAKQEYNLEDAEVANYILFNRSVRENTYDMMNATGNPIMSLEFTEEGRSEPLGSIRIEL